MLDVLPYDGQRYVILDGAICVTALPIEGTPDIALVQSNRLVMYLGGRELGKSMISPSDVWHGERKRNRVQADVCVVLLMLHESRRLAAEYALGAREVGIELVNNRSARASAGATNPWMPANDAAADHRHNARMRLARTPG